MPDCVARRWNRSAIPPPRALPIIFTIMLATILTLKTRPNILLAFAQWLQR